ncbi:MAG: hypothetical protein ACK5DE_09895 [Bacteroidota bacterium]|jgi:hypothetical protein
MNKDKQSGVDSPLVRVLRQISKEIYGETLPLGLEEDLTSIGEIFKKYNPKFKPPTMDEVIAFYATIKEVAEPKQAAEEFWNFYESKGWKVGTAPMKSWQSAAKRAVSWDKIRKKGGLSR